MIMFNSLSRFTLKMIFRYNILVNLFFGLLIGFLVATQIRFFQQQLKQSSSLVRSTVCLNTNNDHNDLSQVKYLRNHEENIFKLSLSDKRNENEESNLRRTLFIGVMTAQKYLDTRALSIYRTWGQHVHDLIFFSSSSSRSEFGLPLISLPTVDDSYPPQKKSFLMLKYLSDNLLTKYEWFFRADDDVYIDVNKLTHFLHTLNSSELHYIGQPGVGNKEEFGQLNLNADDNFCMGGPGVIISHVTLKRLSPYIQTCLKHLYSTHEDVEIGRCIKKYLNLSCTWSYEMNTIFYHNFTGEISSQEPLKDKSLLNAITFHPIKSSQSMYKFHRFFLEREHRLIREQITNQEFLLNKLRNLFDETDTNKQMKRYFNLSSKQVINHSEGNDLIKINLNNIHSIINDTVSNNDETDVNIDEPICIENDNNLLTWSYIDRYFYSENNLNPRQRIDEHIRLALDANMAQLVNSINKQSNNKGRSVEFKSLYYGYTKMNPLSGVQYILDLLLTYRIYRGKKMTLPVRRHAYAVQKFSPIEYRFLNISTQNVIVNIIVPLSGRLEPFKRFIHNFIALYMYDKQVTLSIILFPDATQVNDFNETNKIIKKLTKLQLPIRTAQLGGQFNRAAGLQRGASLFTHYDLLFFVDIDMHLGLNILYNVRLNTKYNQQVYFPIVFSQYDSKYVPTKENTMKENKKMSTINIDGISGYWRQYGFGIVSLYNDDLRTVGGLNIAIQGWGKEDVDLFVKFVHSEINVFRAPERELIHIYHDIKCNSSFLHPAQYEMCLGSQFSSLGSSVNLLNYLSEIYT